MGRVPDPTNNIKSRQQTDIPAVLEKSCPRGLDFNSLAFFEGYPLKGYPSKNITSISLMKNPRRGGYEENAPVGTRFQLFC